MDWLAIGFGLWLGSKDKDESRAAGYAMGVQKANEHLIAELKRALEIRDAQVEYLVKRFHEDINERDVKSLALLQNTNYCP